MFAGGGRDLLGMLLEGVLRQQRTIQTVLVVLLFICIRLQYQNLLVLYIKHQKCSFTGNMNSSGIPITPQSVPVSVGKLA